PHPSAARAPSPPGSAPCPYHDALPISIVQTVPVRDCKTAEAVKLTENIFRSVNIALVNELKVVFHAMGIDVHEVLDAAATKPFGDRRSTRLNSSHVKSSYAVFCLTKTI